MRLPREHASPVAATSVVSLLIPTATDASFDHCIHGIGLADLVHGQWPPGSHLFSEDLPRHFLRRFHDDDLSDAVRIRNRQRDLLSHYDFLASVVARSAASLKAPSV